MAKTKSRSRKNKDTDISLKNHSTGVPKLTTTCAVSLNLNCVLPGYIWTIDNFFTKAECHEWIHWLETKAPPASVMDQPGSRWLAARKCHRWERPHDEELATALWKRLELVLSRCCPIREGGESFNGAFECNPNVRFYKYTEGMSFGKHIDESNQVNFSSGQSGTTRMTLLIYLSDCEGGETRFYDDTDHSCSFSMLPQEGYLLLHRHGDDCLVHEGCSVSKGVKYLLRSDVVFRY